MVQSNFTKTRVVVKFMKMINRFIGCLFKKYEIKIVFGRIMQKFEITFAWKISVLHEVIAA